MDGRRRARGPGAVRAMMRGLRARCPHCGQGTLFERGTLRTPCPNCGLDFERNPGAFIGGVGVNTVVTFGLMLIALVVAFVAVDDAGYWGLVPLVAVAVIVPIAFFRSSKMMWVAVEYVIDPPADGDVIAPAGGDVIAPADGGDVIAPSGGGVTASPGSRPRPPQS